MSMLFIAGSVAGRSGEMVDTPALGAGARKGVEVRVLSSAPKFKHQVLNLNS